MSDDQDGEKGFTPQFQAPVDLGTYSELHEFPTNLNPGQPLHKIGSKCWCEPELVRLDNFDGGTAVYRHRWVH